MKVHTSPAWTSPSMEAWRRFNAKKKPSSSDKGSLKLQIK
jgi:hypothetical protein